jgi:hypothetical protein
VTIIVLISLYALLAGLFIGWRTLVRIRRASPPEGASEGAQASASAGAQGESEPGEILLSWQAVPSPAFRVDLPIALGLTLHGAGVLALGILSSRVTLAVWYQKANWFLRSWDFLAFFLLLFSMTLSWNIIGHLLAQPLLGLLKVPANFAVSGQGLYYGALLQPWGQFSHYSLDETHRKVNLHPANCPQMVTFCLHPPDETSFRRLVQIVRGYLPDRAPPKDLPGVKNPWAFFGLLMLTVYPSVLVGIWLATQPGVLNALYFGLAAFAATRFGGKLIQSYT